MEAKKLLLIEDDNFIRELYQRQLEKAGFLVVAVGNGRLGLEEAAASKFDLILLDIMLPEIDGFKVLQTLKADNKTKDMDVVILSNLGQDDLLNKALSQGAKAYIIKSSTTPAQVVSEVQSIVS